MEYKTIKGVAQNVVIAQVSTNVPVGEEPMVAVRMPDGTVRDTALSRLGRPSTPQTAGDAGAPTAPAVVGKQAVKTGVDQEQAQRALQIAAESQRELAVSESARKELRVRADIIGHARNNM